MHHWTLGWIIFWFGSSFINWFFLMGYYNDQFRKNLRYEDGMKWNIISNLLAGVSGLLVSIFLFRFQNFAWRPLTKNQRDQYEMLKMLESSNDPVGNNFYAPYIPMVKNPNLKGKRKCR